MDYYSFTPNLSATRVRKLVDELDKIAKQDVVKIGNPAKIMFNSEEELLVLLGIQEPDVTATFIPDDSKEIQPEPSRDIKPMPANQTKPDIVKSTLK